MRKNVPNEPHIEDILTVLCSLDGDLLKSLLKQGSPIIVITAVPVSRVRDLDEDDKDDYDDDDDELEDDELEDDELEDEDDEGCCPDYEPADGEGSRCVYSCPECGGCLRQYIEEEFE